MVAALKLAITGATGFVGARLLDAALAGAHSVRALTLRMLGYQTDIVEFVSTDHTARNLMIRAVRGAPIGDAMFIKEYQALRQFCGVKPYLESLLGEPFQRLVPTKILPGEPAT